VVIFAFIGISYPIILFSKNLTSYLLKHFNKILGYILVFLLIPLFILCPVIVLVNYLYSYDQFLLGILIALLNTIILYIQYKADEKENFVLETENINKEGQKKYCDTYDAIDIMILSFLKNTIFKFFGKLFCEFFKFFKFVFKKSKTLLLVIFLCTVAGILSFALLSFLLSFEGNVGA
jgi:hypothetical protein